MADIRLRIEVNPDAETETLGTITNKVNDVGTNSNLSNVSFKASSSGEYADRTATNENGREMLSWANNGVLQFNSDGLLSTDGLVAGALASETDPDMFVWGAVPESKQYSVKLTFSKATSLKDIVVYGDKTANQFPTKAIIDGTKTIYSDDYQWAINMETESDTHTIEFVEWNRANYNACLTRIMVMLRYFDLDKGWIDSVESLTQSTSDPSSIQYGVLANSGSATIRDLDGELEDYVQDGIIQNSNMKAKLVVNNNVIQEHIVTDSSYYNKNKTLHLEMMNAIKDWNTLYYSGRDVTYNENLYNLLCEVLLYFGYRTEEIELMMSSYIKKYLKLIIIPYAYLTKDTFLNTINKICTLAQLSVYFNNNGFPVFVSARPIITQDEKEIIKVPTYSMISSLKSDIFIKNKYDGLRINEFLVSENFISNKNIYSTTQLNTESKISEMLYDSSDRKTVRVDTYYSSGNITIPKKSNLGLETITNVSYSWDYAIDYLDKYVYLADSAVNINAEAYMSNTERPIGYIKMKDLTSALDDQENSVTGRDKVYNIKMLNNSIIGNTWFSSWVVDGRNITYSIDNAKVSFMDNSRINISEDETSYKINYNVLSKLVFCGLARPGEGTIGDTGFFLNEVFISSINFDFQGDKHTIRMDEVSVSTDNIENARTIVKIDNNELLQSETKLADTKISDVIKNHILNDYRNGIKTGELQLFCCDFVGDDKIKNWNNGEIFCLREILKCSSVKEYWKTAGIKFNYDGSPSQILTIQECNRLDKTCKINIKYPKNTDSQISIKDFYGNIVNDGDYVESGSLLQVTVSGNFCSVEITSNEKTIISQTKESSGYAVLSGIIYISKETTIRGTVTELREGRYEFDIDENTYERDETYNQHYELAEFDGKQVTVGVAIPTDGFVRYPYVEFVGVSTKSQIKRFEDSEVGNFNVTISKNFCQITDINITNSYTVRINYYYFFTLVP